MKPIILILVLLISCKEKSIIPKTCYECELTRITSYKNLLVNEKSIIVHSKFSECFMSYNQLITRYNYVSIGDNTEISQKTTCKRL